MEKQDIRCGGLSSNHEGSWITLYMPALTEAISDPLPESDMNVAAVEIPDLITTSVPKNSDEDQQEKQRNVSIPVEDIPDSFDFFP
ncbi:OLC1v1036495C1 [Oldenlandia corymbosa var. corymbosa]|uniref:OLC1v1036495C1 n=1 Tax=Oldenlandia corymbosa var. corymbosa TaxID=529605 RepID=A0AAV1CZ00_OLDCO|nr:OLC1v1036495C1 [Oldenlandia corymbosa var. corymbosa]